jgi:hypothetical protein
MHYLLLIYENEKVTQSLTQAELGTMMADYNAFTQAVKASGQLVNGNRLHDVAKATTVRIRDGKTQITDGPFAETREQLGGYYLIEAKNLDEATALAAKIPAAKSGSIEIRPVWEM